MENSNFITNVLICFMIVIIAPGHLTLKTCSRSRASSCPKNSLCAQIKNDENEALKCICIENFQLNPYWSEIAELKSFASPHDLYCISSSPSPKSQENKLILYVRSPAGKKHFAFAMLLVLLAATLLTIVLYGLKTLYSLRRIKSFYRLLENKYRSTKPLQETDELELNRCYEMQILQIDRTS